MRIEKFEGNLKEKIKGKGYRYEKDIQICKMHKFRVKTQFVYSL